MRTNTGAKACPRCGGSDRFFLVTNPRNGGDPFWHCRHCRHTEGGDPASAKPTTKQLTDDQIDQAHRGYSAAAAWCAGELWTPAGTEALDYLHSRGLTDATILAAGLGWHLDHWRDGAGLALWKQDRDAYEGARLGGLLGPQAKPKSVLRGVVTFPYRRSGIVAMLRSRKLDPGTGPKYLSPAGVPLYAGGDPCFFLHDELAATNKVIMTEGEIKGLVATQAYRNGQLSMPAIAQPGIGVLPDQLITSLANKEVFLVYDTEERTDPFQPSPGERYTIRNGEKLTGRHLEQRRGMLEKQLGKAKDSAAKAQIEAEIVAVDAELAAFPQLGIIVRVVRLPRPADVAKVDLDSFILEHGPEALQQLLDRAPLFADWYAHHGPSPYRYEQGGMWNGKWLANYQARVVEDIKQNDGIETSALHRVALRSPSGHTQIIEVPGNHWADPRKAIEALRAGLQDGTWDDEGQEALRATKALSRLGDGPTRRMSHTCTGWERIAERWHYLMPDGAISATGSVTHVRSELPNHALGNHYELASVPGDATLGAQVFKRLLMGEAGAQPLALLLAGHAAGAVLHRFMTDGGRPIVYLEGESGVYKSALARVYLSLYGPRFTAEAGDGAPLPKWESTYNALELTAFTYRDTLLCIDDYKQATASKDVLARFLHAYSETSSRGRMTRDLKQQRTFPARGLAIITGEDRPSGDSGQLGRVLLCPIRRGDINSTVLQELQQAGVNGHLAAFWREFIEGIAGGLDKHGEDQVRKLIADLIRQDESLPGHPRTAGALRQNRKAWLVLSRWMQDAGHLTKEEAAYLDRAHLEARRYSAEAQEAAQRDERPSTKWLDVLRSQIATGECVIDDGSLDEEKVKPERVIAWSLPSGAIAIITSKASAVVEKAMGKRTLQYSESAIYAQLRSDGILVDDGSKQKTNTQLRRYRGVQLRVLVLEPSALYGSGPVTPGTDGIDKAVTASTASESHKTVSVTPVTPVTPNVEQTTHQVLNGTVPKTQVSPTNRCNGVTAAVPEHQKATEAVTPLPVTGEPSGVTAPRMPLSGTPLIPQIKREKIRFVLEKLPDRGPMWARTYMDEVEGFDKWPAHVQQQVKQAEAGVMP